MTIKHIITSILLLSNYALALGQDSLAGTFFQTSIKTRLYYVDLKNSVVYVYKVGSYLDKAGTGYSIINVDTLIKQPDDSYVGKNTKLINENNKSYLVTKFRKEKKFLIETVKNPAVVNNNLNNAHYLDSYFKMSDELNKRYPLNHHSFRNGFHSWKELHNKEVDYLQFREFAKKRLKAINDSICSLQDSRVVLTNYIIEKLGTFDYSILKDSLMKLPAEYGSLSRYYGTVINEVAKQKPEYFFELAADFPGNRSLIFSAVEDDKEVIQRLKRVAGHDDIKKEFFKDRRFGKTMPYKAIGMYAIVIGLVALLIVSQK